MALYIMEKNPQLKLAIVGDSTVDLFIKVRSDRFPRFNQTMSVEDIIATNRVVAEEDEARGSLVKRLGGPVLTVGQYLAGRDDTSGNPLPFAVSAVTISGSDKYSIMYKDPLMALGIKYDQERGFEGNLARCAYVYDADNPTRQIMAWEDGVSSHFKDIKVERDFLSKQDVLVLATTEPSLGARLTKDFRSCNQRGIVVYNPGPNLQDKKYSNRDKQFRYIIKNTDILVVNEPERRVLNQRMGLTVPRLFGNNRLEVMVSTRDKTGSVIHYRDPKNRRNHTLVSTQEATEGLVIENPTGSGDAFLGTFLRYHLGLGYDIRDAHGKARVSAERQLTETGAVHETLVKSGDLPSFDEFFGRYRFVEAK